MKAQQVFICVCFFIGLYNLYFEILVCILLLFHMTVMVKDLLHSNIMKYAFSDRRRVRVGWVYPVYPADPQIVRALGLVLLRTNVTEQEIKG